MVQVIATLIAAFSLATVAHAAVERGLPWATDWNFAPAIAKLPKITWYHQWENGPVDTMPSKVEFVPMFWGPSKWSQWSQTLAIYKNKPAPKHMFAFNEPDVTSQSNMDPTYAATLFMQQIYPWRAKGTKVGSPSIVWKIEWMKTFLSALKSKGGDIDMLCLHWYGSWNDLAGCNAYIQKAHALAPSKPIWLLEIGITTASKPSQQQVKNFLMNAYAWMDTQSYIERAAWFGAFTPSSPPDNYATGKNALLKDSGAIGDMGKWYGYTALPDKRFIRSVYARDGDQNSTNDAVHCDEFCILRNDQIGISL